MSEVPLFGLASKKYKVFFYLLIYRATFQIEISFRTIEKTFYRFFFLHEAVFILRTAYLCSY